jgi:hypothetical protein
MGLKIRLLAFLEAMMRANASFSIWGYLSFCTVERFAYEIYRLLDLLHPPGLGLH